MIPVFRPFGGQEEIDAVADVIRSGWWGLGPRTAEFERRFGEAVGADECVGTNSASAALALSLLALDVKGREVITTSLTFVSTNHAILQAGATPVFADIEPETLTIDPAEVERLISPRTAAIMVVDYGGHPASLAEIGEIAGARGIPVVEDAAHACGASYRGRPIGSISPFTCFSFHAVKNLAMGEGGAITLADPELAARLRRLRWMGLTRDTWQRTSERSYDPTYEVEELGFKGHLSDIAAAIGLVQLDRLPATNARRRQIAERYGAAFRDLAWLTTPGERPDVRSAWHLYVIRLADGARRGSFMRHLADLGVASSIHYKPNHLHRLYREFARPLPVTESVWPRLVTLPLFPGLSDDDADHVIDAVRSFGA